jgi:hypothetical protein
MLQGDSQAGACGGMIGGRSKPKVELATAKAVFKAAKLTFIVIAPVYS